VQALRADAYDLVVDLQGLLKSSLVALASRAPIRLGVAPQREGAAFVSRTVPLPASNAHAVDRYLQCAAFLGAATDPVDFGLSADPAAVASVERLLSREKVDLETPLILINPSASRPWKAWSTERWARVSGGLKDLGTVVVIGSAAQAEVHREIVGRTGNGVVDLTGTTTLSEVIALLARCAIHIAPDTGTLHIAAALGRPVVGVYGPTAPAALGPYGQLGFAVYQAGLCGPTCPRWCWRNRRCLNAIVPEDVIGRARLALAAE
jgi:ADP-heptose:LPS heptosyltransferase